jgi:hypothetical protein
MFDIFCPNYIEGVNGQTTSGQSGLYNCIAHSVQMVLTYIWPDEDEEYSWPPNLDRNDHIDTFVKFYRACGFEPCSDASLEQAYEKVILYGVDKTVLHAARQLPDGSWTSKVGDLTDVMHVTPNVVTSHRNGTPMPPTVPPLHPPLTQLVSSSGVPLQKLASST